MTAEQEVKDTYAMLKTGGFKVAEIIFEGGISVKDTEILSVLQKLVDQGKAFGTVKVVYLSKDGQPRVIEIPAGQQEEAEQAPTK